MKKTVNGRFQLDYIYKTNDIALLIIISLILPKVSKIYTDFRFLPLDFWLLQEAPAEISKILVLDNRDSLTADLLHELLYWEVCFSKLWKFR